MKRRVFSLLLMLVTLLPMLQAQQLTPLPLKPEVKSGKLANGLTYYILHNEEPKQRANFYIAQKVGSTLEDPDQLGLAHFLEHMAFNGTEHYPGKNMLNYLQSKGIRFGADINAYTSFDETVYNLNNIPTNDQALMDSVLLVLRDWSGSILLEESEIEAERGVIQEEWRSRNTADVRMYTSILPALYEEYQYEQMPIGKMEVVMNFKPEVLRAYYKKWYRPDQQGIVIVGDFDADAMEKKVIEMFSGIPMPENAAERTYATVSDNKEPIYASFEDAELQNDMIMVSFKFDKTPFEYRNTVEAYFSDNIIPSITCMMLNKRLSERSEDPTCQYAYCGVRVGDYYVSKTKGAFNVVIIPKGDSEAAMSDAMAVIARACKAGFTTSELDRANSELLASYEVKYNERDKTDSDVLGNEIIRHFIDNEPTPGIETEYMLLQQMTQMMPIDAYNAYAQQILSPENQVIVVSQHLVEGRVLPAKETMVAALNNAINAEYEAYVDEVITDPLIRSLAPAGSVVAEQNNAELGTTEFTLSNGVKVIVKSTDFAADQVLMSAYKNGGKRSYKDSEASDVLLIADAFESSKMGTFDVKTLSKYLAGKKVALSYDINMSTTMFDGSSTVKDLPTFFELIYAAFTDLNPDKTYYDNMIERVRSILANQEQNPQFIFSKELSALRWKDNPMMQQAGLSLINGADYDRMFAMIKESVKNAADYTFVFSGNIDAATIKPLLEKYIANLPSTGVRTEMPIINDISLNSGDVTKEVKVNMQNPAVYVFGSIDGTVQYNMYNDITIKLIADVLDMVYINTLREEEGGTYGAQVATTLIPYNNQWSLYYVFQTGMDMKDKLIARANQELLKLLSEGTDADTFNKVKEAALAQYDINVRTNKYWTETIVSIERGYNLHTGYREMLSSLTLDEFNNYMSNLYNGQSKLLLVEVPAE
ncbi:MAG: insulinase family protein [Muribaculaceae bacterium]|nr:insulinase family protein [Muribaculaceae bacterium]